MISNATARKRYEALDRMALQLGGLSRRITEDKVTKELRWGIPA